MLSKVKHYCDAEVSTLHVQTNSWSANMHEIEIA